MINRTDITLPTKRTLFEIGDNLGKTLQVAPTENNRYLDIRLNKGVGREIQRSYFGLGEDVMRLNKSGADELIRMIEEAKKELVGAL